LTTQVGYIRLAIFNPAAELGIPEFGCIHLLAKMMDCRVKPGNDVKETLAERMGQ
jgi:hypothetical protein